jgi:hypothetical protein
MAETLKVEITETMTIGGEEMKTAIVREFDDASDSMKRILRLSNSTETVLWETDSVTTDIAGHTFFYRNVIYARITNCDDAANVYIKLMGGSDSVYYTIRPTASFILWDHNDNIAYNTSIVQDTSGSTDDIQSVTAMSNQLNSNIEIFIVGNK